jgi:hypothetical protein
MTIALSVGINASVRTLSSLSRTSRTDTASRALAAAEGGIERYLALSSRQLEEAVAGSCPEGSYDNESASCLIDFDASADVLTSQAFVTVERYEPTFYPFSLESGQVKEINLYDFNSTDYYTDTHTDITICWSSVTDSDLMYLSYSRTGIESRGGLEGANSPGAPYDTGGFTPAGAGNGDYDNCQDVTVGAIGSNAYGLRIRSLGGASNVGIYPDSGATLPLQGYRISSIGKLEQDQAVTATRVIRIIRTLPYLPVSFDYALYSEGGVVK